MLDDESDTDSLYEKEYNRIKEVYYPRWDRLGRWNLEIKDDLDGANGRANAENKINLSRGFKGPYLSLLIIHEIAHAVVGPSHEKKWRNRMSKAYETAIEIGEDEIANLIQKELDGYEESIKITADIVYGTIKDAILENPEATFDIIVEMVRRNLGITKDFFNAHYKRANKVFEDTKKLCSSFVKSKNPDWDLTPTKG